MQVLSMVMEQVLIPDLKLKQMDLVDEILTRINRLEDEDKAGLLALIAPKLSEDNLLEALGRVLSLQDNLYLSKGLALIAFLPYLPTTELTQVSKEILKCIWIAKNKPKRADKLELVNSFLNQLERHKRRIDWFGYLIEISQEIPLSLKVGFGFDERVALAGKSFKLMYFHDCYKHYSLYDKEKAYLLEIAKKLDDPITKYLLLLGLLEHYPLSEREISKIARQALKALKALSFSLELKNELNDKVNVGDINVDGTDNNKHSDTVALKEQIKLLYFLPRREKKLLLSSLCREIAANTQRQIQLGDLVYLLGYTCAKKTGGIERNWPVVKETEKYINDLIDYFYEEEVNCDQQYFDLIKFLTGPTFNEVYGRMWSDVVMKLVQDIKCPITKADALLLMLEKTKVAQLKMTLNLKLSKTIKLIPDKVEELNFRIKNLSHFQKESQQETAAKILAEIALLPSTNEAMKAEFLVEVLPYLTPTKRREAFLVANTIENEFDRTWATIGFTNYLTKDKKRKVIKSGLNIIDSASSDEDKVLLIKQLIKYSLPTSSK